MGRTRAIARQSSSWPACYAGGSNAAAQNRARSSLESVHVVVLVFCDNMTLRRLLESTVPLMTLQMRSAWGTHQCTYLEPEIRLGWRTVSTEIRRRFPLSLPGREGEAMKPLRDWIRCLVSTILEAFFPCSKSAVW